MNRCICFLLLILPVFCFSQKQFEVFFDFNKDFPNQSSILTINEWMASHKNIEITKLLGYCDSIDTKNYNKKLAERRIESVRKLLEKNGLKFNKNLEKIAIGKDFKQSKIQAENRKVIISYIKPETDTLTGLNDSIPFFSLELSKIVDIEKATLEAKFQTNSKGDLIRIYGIQFYLNSTKIIEMSEPMLKELLRIMYVNPKLKIEIQGHICCQFVNDYSGLSTLRAKTIYKYLIKNNINKLRLRYVGFGTLKPIYKIPEQNKMEEQGNRRVEILILDK